MRFRTRAALAASGFLALTGTLAAALPASAAPSSDYPPIPDSVAEIWVGQYRDSVLTQPVGAFTCPVDHPWRWNGNLGWGALGADVRPNTNRLDVRLDLVDTVGPDGLVNGWAESPEGMTIERLRREVPNLYILCTNDPTEAYAPAPSSTQ